MEIGKLLTPTIPSTPHAVETSKQFVGIFFAVMSPNYSVCRYFSQSARV